MHGFVAVERRLVVFNYVVDDAFQPTRGKFDSPFLSLYIAVWTVYNVYLGHFMWPFLWSKHE